MVDQDDKFINTQIDELLSFYSKFDIELRDLFDVFNFPEKKLAINDNPRLNMIFKPTKMVKSVVPEYCDIEKNNYKISFKIPTECFKDDDRYDYKYLIKQSLYISHFIKNIKDIEYFICFSGVNNDGLFSFIPNYFIILPSKQNAIIQLNMFSQKDVISNYLGIKKFKSNQFSPQHSLIKKTVNGTSFYNSLLLSQIINIYADYHTKLPDFSIDISKFKSLISLIKIWSKLCRILNSDQHISINLNVFYLNFALWLIHNQKIHLKASNLENFKAFLFQLKSVDMVAGLSFNNSLNNIIEWRNNIAIFKEHFDMVFLDTTGLFNICFNYTTNDYYWIKEEAFLAYKNITCSVHPDPFLWLFTKKKPFELSFDHVLRISIPIKPYIKRITDKNILNEEIVLEDNGSLYRALKKKILQVLNIGLDGFANLIVLKPTAYIKVKGDDHKPKNVDNENYKFTIGIRLKSPIQTDYLFSKSVSTYMIKGPQIHNIDPKLEETFSQFWGPEICSDRKFSDGTVCKVALFDQITNNGFEYRNVFFGKIVRYLLKRHCQMEFLKPLKKYVDYNEARSYIEYVALTQKIRIKHYGIDAPKFPLPTTNGDEGTGNEREYYPYGTGEELFYPIARATDNLVKILTSDSLNESLALKIARVTNSFDPISRKTEVFPPLPIRTFRNNLDKTPEVGCVTVKQRKFTGQNSVASHSSRNFSDIITKGKKVIPYTSCVTLFVWPEESHKWPEKIRNTDAYFKLYHNNHHAGHYNEADKDDDKHGKRQDKSIDTKKKFRKVTLDYPGALYRLSLAFLIELKTNLQDFGARCSLVSELNHRNGNIATDLPYYNLEMSYLEVLHDGYLFKLCFVCPPLIQTFSTFNSNFYNKYCHELGTTNLKETDPFDILYKLNAALSRLESVYPLYPLTARLVKRWLASHMLLSLDGTESLVETLLSPKNHGCPLKFTELWVDIIVSHLFLCPEPFNAINSGTLGLFRFLHLLATHDWAHEPLYLPLFSFSTIDLGKTVNVNDTDFVTLCKRLRNYFKRCNEEYRRHIKKMTSFNSTKKLDNLVIILDDIDDEEYLRNEGLLIEEDDVINFHEEMMESGKHFDGLLNSSSNRMVNSILTPNSVVFRRAITIAQSIYTKLFSNADLSENYLIKNTGPHANPLNFLLESKKLLLPNPKNSYQHTKKQQRFDHPLKQTLKEILFSPQLTDFDIVINIKKSKISRLHQNVLHPSSLYKPGGFKFKDGDHDDVINGHRPGQEIPTRRRRSVGVKTQNFSCCDFDPIKIYVKDMEERLGKYALFFYDSFGGNVIGVVWKPIVFEKQQIYLSTQSSLNIPPYFKPSISKNDNNTTNEFLVDGEYNFDFDAFLQDMRLLGKGIIHSIEIKTERWK